MTAIAGGDLEGLREVAQADVYKGGQLAASLTRTPDGVEFRYLEGWIASGGRAVATTLPVSATPLVRVGGALPAYFAGLLPEGRRLGALRRAVKTSADDELSLLLAVGSDAVGDVQVVSASVSPAEVPPRVTIDEIGAMRFADLLVELGIQAQRTALPGVQDKTSAAMINLPVARAGERYILKLNPVSDYPHLVENEAFFLAAARKSGLSVPDFRLVFDRDDAPGLLIHRFDRVTVGGQLAARAVEDGCQVADRPPADKYLLGTDRTFQGLLSVCDAPVVAARDLLRQLAFAYLTGNGDAHAKNFSVLQDDVGEWRISPAYDLPCSYLYGDKSMAMSINGRSGGDVRTRDFAELATRLGLPARATSRVLLDLVERTELWIGDLDLLPFDSGQLGKLRRVIRNRRDRLAHAV